MAIQRFEDLEVWQNARALCKKIRFVVNTTSLGKDFSLKDQILRSSGSCMDNISEGFERDGNKEFKNFLIISKGSIGETRSQVYRSYDAGHLSEETFNDLLNDCLSLSKQLSGFINYIGNNKFLGRNKKPPENTL
jgi:four helix bundle protein